MRTMTTTVFLLLSMTTAVVVGYGSGPPVTTVSTLCDSMVPGHGNSTAMGDNPYTLTVSREGETNSYTVRLAGANDETLQGFFIQARPWNSSSSSESTPADSVGTFASSAAGTQLIDCFDRSDNAWGHSDMSDKNGVEATWAAPVGSGDVRFRASVVQGPYTAFWVELYSDVISYNNTASTEAPMTTDTEEPMTTDTEAPMTTDTAAAGVRFSTVALVLSLLLTFLTMTRM